MLFRRNCFKQISSNGNSVSTNGSRHYKYETEPNALKWILLNKSKIANNHGIASRVSICNCYELFREKYSGTLCKFDLLKFIQGDIMI